MTTEEMHYVLIKISASCERYMSGQVSMAFLKECMNKEDVEGRPKNIGMNELRMEIEKQENKESTQEAVLCEGRI